MTRKTWIIAGATVAVAVLATAGALLWWSTANTTNPEESPVVASGTEQGAQAGSGSDGHDHDEAHVHAVEETGPEVWRERSEEGEYLDILDTPEAFLERGLGLAAVWVTFDSRETDAARERQLAPHIENPADWTALPEELLHPQRSGAGDATRYTVAEVDGAPSINESWTFSADGSHSVSVDIPFTVRYFGDSASRKPLAETWNWTFEFDESGELTGVDGPETDL
ncbi:hypothetical protein J4H92_01785 [Leucobacter weissii]|uniref:Uncharacterized protein n=1 Tax=Leucobacter weissii TaxID=1983706 RepID=A0A939MHF1_9MICO|nr:hypothetical protein [Leucobacter weissii]MBO1900676.1 hypothetical protein [Leucobacter weissii]